VSGLLDLDCNRHDRRSYREHLADIFAHPKSDPSVVGAAEAYLAGAAATPLGAAAVVGAAAAAFWGRYPAASFLSQFTAFADHWVATEGVVFAARAAAHLGGLYLGAGRRTTGRSWDDKDYVHPLSTDDERFLPLIPWHIAVERTRAHLAACSDADYAAAVDALAALRGGPLTQRIVTSYLAPTRTDWVDADCAARAAVDDQAYWVLRDRLLLCSVGTEAQLTTIADKVERGAALRPERETLFGPTVFPTIAEGVGPGAAGTFERWFRDGFAKADTRKRLMGALAEFDTDEAFGLLVEHADHSDARAALEKARKRYPDRAARLG
jgi:hypothetical protein